MFKEASDVFSTRGYSVFFNARFDTRVSGFKTRAFAHLSAVQVQFRDARDCMRTT